MKTFLLLAVSLLAVPSFAAGAPKKPAKAAPALTRVAGKVVGSSAKTAAGKKGRVFVEGRLTILDDAGHTEEYLVDAKTKVTCDGKKASFQAAAVPGACDRVARLMYDAHKRAHVLELKTAVKADADDAQGGRPNVSGEVAVTDVLGGRISVRLGGGTTLDFKVGDATKITREAEGKPGDAMLFEAIKVGDRVEVRSRDWKTADEIHVRAPAR